MFVNTKKVLQQALQNFLRNKVISTVTVKFNAGVGCFISISESSDVPYFPFPLYNMQLCGQKKPRTSQHYI